MSVDERNDDWLAKLDKVAAKSGEEEWSIGCELRTNGHLRYGYRLAYLKDQALTTQSDEGQDHAQEDRGQKKHLGPVHGSVRALSQSIPEPRKREPPETALPRWKASIWRSVRPKVLRCGAQLLGFDAILPSPVRVSSSTQPGRRLQFEPLGPHVRLTPQPIIDCHRLLTGREGVHFTYYLLSREVCPDEPELPPQTPLLREVLTARANLAPMPDNWTTFKFLDHALPRVRAALIGVIAPHEAAYFGLWVLLGRWSESLEYL